jgi:hypothetical protein
MRAVLPDAEEIAELPIEIGGAALRVLDGPDRHVGQGAEVLAHEPEHDALAGARVAADEREAAVGDAGLDAPQEGMDRGRNVERLDGHVGAKGIKFEAVKGQEPSGHVKSSCSLGVESCADAPSSPSPSAPPLRRGASCSTLGK